MTAANHFMQGSQMPKHALALSFVAQNVIDRLARDTSNPRVAVMMTLADYEKELMHWLRGSGAMQLVGSVQHEGDIALTTFATFERDGNQFPVYVGQKPLTY